MVENSPKIAPFRFRYAMLILAIIIFGQVQLPHLSVSKIAAVAYQNLASISSINASIPPNEYNTLAQQFSEKDKQLTAREQELIAREKALDAKYQAEISANKITTLYTIGGVTLTLVLLILANFYFDIKREEERERQLLAQKGITETKTT